MLITPTADIRYIVNLIPSEFFHSDPITGRTPAICLLLNGDIPISCNDYRVKPEFMELLGPTFNPYRRSQVAGRIIVYEENDRSKLLMSHD